MKKLLYGTTAIVAASMLGAGAASAAEPITLSVGGYYQTYFAVIDADDTAGASYQSTVVGQTGEIHFTGETTLDNGLQVGINVQLEAYTTDIDDVTGDQIDEHYVYLEGGWGRLEIGAENGAAYKAGGSWVPSGIVGHGVDSPEHLQHPTRGSAVTTTQITTSNDANKISYYTPRMGGFQLGVSYTPDVGDDIAGGGVASPRTALIENGSGGASVEDVFEIGANWSGTFGGVDLGINAGYLTGDENNDDREVDEWRVGGQIGYGGFTLVGNYNDEDTMDGLDGSQAFTTGLSYGTGPWTVAVGYLHSENDLVMGAGENDKRDHYEIGASYALGPGVTISGGLQYYETETDSVTNRSTAGIIAMGLTF